VTLLWKTCLVRFFTAALLLVGPSSVSKVICISPTGHDAIEDWAASCCVPGADDSGTALSEASPCQGCTDRPIAPAIEIKGPQTDSSHPVSYDNSAVAVAQPSGPEQMSSIRLTLGFGRQLDPVNSQLLITSLRC
jgi:hypothetical protein